MKVTFEKAHVYLREGPMSICFANIKDALSSKPYFIYGGDKEKVKKEILKAKIKSI